MASAPLIFLSAVSAELKTARNLLDDTLRSLGITPVVQETFGAPGGDLREVLREKINPCNGLIQLVGSRYGWEPPSHDNPLNPLSYTQFEACHALGLKLKVWFFLVDDSFPGDPATPEEKDKATLQSAWRVRIRGLGHIYEKIADLKDIQIQALKTGHEINKLFGPGLASEDLTVQHLAKIEQALASLAQVRSEAAQSGNGGDEADIEHRAYAILEKKFGLPTGSLASELPRLAEKLIQARETSLLDRARALFAEKVYAQAESVALEAKAHALSPAGLSLQDAIAALELAGNAAREQIHYAQALDHFRTAAVFTDEKRDALEWARVQHMIAYVLAEAGKSQDAERILQRVVVVYQRVLGAEHPDILSSRNNLANTLHAQGKYDEAETEHRAVLAIRERVLGVEHPNVLQSRNNLANALNAQGKHGEAEKEHRAVLAIRERVLGAEHPDTLQSRNNLAIALRSQDKNEEAEKEHRDVLAIRERVLEHFNK